LSYIVKYSSSNKKKRFSNESNDESEINNNIKKLNVDETTTKSVGGDTSIPAVRVLNDRLEIITNNKRRRRRRRHLHQQLILMKMKMKTMEMIMNH
jgi:hypothetical protein